MYRRFANMDNETDLQNGRKLSRMKIIEPAVNLKYEKILSS